MGSEAKRTARHLARWAAVMDRLAQGPSDYGPHDTEQVCAALERVCDERDRLARILAVERGDEAQAPEGWQRRGRWFGPSGASVLRGDAPAGGQAWVAYGWESQVIGWFRHALEAMEAADAADAARGEVTP